MNQKNEIFFLFENCHWENLANLYSPKTLVEFLSFKDGLRLAYRLLYNDNWNENLQEYAVKLLYEIRDVYREDWNNSWEYDAFLGTACYITRKYEERYEFYKRALEKTNNPPPGLLLEFARCCICPGPPPISYDDAITLVMIVLKKAPYTDAIGLLSHIYSLKDDKKNEEHWTRILEKSNQELVTPSIDPKFLIGEYLEEMRLKNK
jgi:tetratricopeptide (TPR) repeat protein